MSTRVRCKWYGGQLQNGEVFSCSNNASISSHSEKATFLLLRYQQPLMSILTKQQVTIIYVSDSNPNLRRVLHLIGCSSSGVRTPRLMALYLCCNNSFNRDPVYVIGTYLILFTVAHTKSLSKVY